MFRGGETIGITTDYWFTGESSIMSEEDLKKSRKKEKEEQEEQKELFEKLDKLF